jgi:hypothetical protein
MHHPHLLTPSSSVTILKSSSDVSTLSRILAAALRGAGTFQGTPLFWHLKPPVVDDFVTQRDVGVCIVWWGGGLYRWRRSCSWMTTEVKEQCDAEHVTETVHDIVADVEAYMKCFYYLHSSHTLDVEFRESCFRRLQPIPLVIRLLALDDMEGVYEPALPTNILFTLVQNVSMYKH